MIYLIIVYVLIMFAIGGYSYIKNEKSDDEYLVCGRSQGWVSSGLSVGATWIWAPALFVSAQQAYTNGLVGFFWFFVPNVLTLIFFGYVASRFVRKFPQGYTLPQYMDSLYGGKVHKLYLLQFTVLQVMSMAVQLLAGGAVIALMTGWSYPFVVLFLALVAFGYSSLGGLRASMVTDAVQMIFMIIAGIISVILVISKMESGAISQGLAGINGLGGSLFSKHFITVMLTTGITTTIGLLAGPIGDQMFWQRVYAVRPENIRKSFTVGAISFGLIPLLFGLVGFAGAGSGFEAQNVEMVNMELVNKFAPPAITFIVTILIMAGLGSTMDSGYCAITSLAEVDYKKYLRSVPKMALRWGSMLLLALFAILIALIPNLQIFHLFLFYGTIRATTFIPTLVTILSKEIPDEKYIRRGLLLSLCVGVPAYAMGSIVGIWYLNLIGILLTVGLSGIFAWAGVLAERRNA
jgi:Na+/proline symporter